MVGGGFVGLEVVLCGWKWLCVVGGGCVWLMVVVCKGGKIILQPNLAFTTLTTTLTSLHNLHRLQKM